MPQEHHHTIMSDGFKDESDALIDVTRKATELHRRTKKIVHIIYANIIWFQGEWKAIASVTSLCEFGFNNKPADVFGYLPLKYGAHYDALVNEVDHLNIINQQKSWIDIKRILLDLHFFQAVHFGLIKRMSGNKGEGYLKSQKDVMRFDNDFKPNFEAHYEDKFQHAVASEHVVFEVAIEHSTTQTIAQEQDNLNRNLREGRRYKNLIFKLNID